MSVVGIKETKEALVAVLQCGVIVKSALADGKISLGDLGLVLPAIKQLNIAVDGSVKIPVELADLQAGEYDELVAAATPMLKELAPDQIEQTIFLALGIAKSILELLGLIK
jgi:hypothetical protein